MTPKALLELCKQQEEMGLTHVMLKMPYPESWIKRGYGSKRVKTPFGLCNYSQGRDTLLIYPTLEQIRVWFTKVMEQ